MTARRGPTPVFTRASSGTFVGSDGLIQTAAVNAARFDHTSDGVCRGLLIEESRTNLNVRSEELSNAAYSSQGLLPVISNVSIAPDGNTSADRIVENTSNAIHRLFTPVFNATSGTTYTASVFAKSNGRRYLYLNAGSPFNAQATFDLQNGVVSGAGAGSSAITKLNNGWYRCAVTGTATVTNAVVVSLHINNTVSLAFDDIYTGDGTSGLLLWGAQVEAGSFPTSYIPTVASTVVRSADVCSITGANFTSFYNQSEGTCYVASERISAGSSFAALARYSDNTNNNRINIGNVGNPHNIEFLIASSGTTTFQQSLNTTAFKKASLAYKANDANYAVNGSLGTQDNTVTLPSVNQFDVGSGQIIAAIRFYKKRLPNAKLQALTA
jgi:hypothetical protein